MTRRFWAFAVALVPAFVLGWAPTRALAAEELKVNVPFQFVVGDSVLPAGSYRIQASDTNPSVIWFFSPNGHHVANVATEWGGAPFSGSDPRLRFEVYGKTHFLSGILIPGEDGRMVPLSRHEVERELARLAEQRASRS